MIKASQAGTSLRQILLGLQGGVELATKSTDKWRIEVENSDGSMRNLNDVVVDLREAFADMTDAQKASNAEAIAGKIGMSGLLSIVNASEKDFNKLTGAIDNSTGVAKNMAETMQNNLKGKITAFKSALEGAGIAIGENFLPALTTIVEKVTGVVSAFGKLDSSTQKTIVKVGLVTAAIGPLLAIGGKLVTGIGSVIKVVSTVTSLVGTGLLSSLSVVAAPLLVVAGGFYAWHEAVDAGNQSIAVAREEMSFMERTMADLTGMTTYSKDELIDMGLVYKDFNENISTDFQDKVKDMTIDIHDFGMSLEEINVDKVITEEEANNLTTRVNEALESCISAIDNNEDIKAKGYENHRKNNISLIFQNYNLIDYMTPLENIRIVNSKADKRILNDLGLKDDEINRNVLKLSGGQQQRVAIARTLAANSPVILADEPTGNLDSDTEDEIIEILKKNAHQQGKCVIVVTHSKELARKSDVILELKDKKLTY